MKEILNTLNKTQLEGILKGFKFGGLHLNSTHHQLQSKGAGYQGKKLATALQLFSTKEEVMSLIEKTIHNLSFSPVELNQGVYDPAEICDDEGYYDYRELDQCIETIESVNASIKYITGFSLHNDEVHSILHINPQDIWDHVLYNLQHYAAKYTRNYTPLNNGQITEVTNLLKGVIKEGI